MKQEYRLEVERQNHKEDKYGEAPLAIRLTCIGRTYFYLKLKCKPEEWDERRSRIKPNVKNAVQHNADINREVSKIEQRIFQLKNEGKAITAKLVKDSFNKPVSTRDIFVYAKHFFPLMQGKWSDGYLSRRMSDVKTFQKYVGGSCSFDEVDTAMLRKYESHLRKKGKLTNNTTLKVLKALQRIFTAAIKDGIATNNPFVNFDKPKYIQPETTFLTLEEVNRFEDYVFNKCPEGKVKVSGAYFLLGCYSGLRISDQIKFNKDRIQGDRLILYAKKNKNIVSIQIHHKLKRVIDYIIESGKKCPSDQGEFIKVIAKADGVDIEKNITPHVSRHSFAVRCAELGLSIEVTSTLMGISIRTCLVYYKITDRKIDNEVKVWNTL